MGKPEPGRRVLYTRTQTIAALLLVAILAAGLFLIKHEGLSATTIIPGAPTTYALRLDVNSAPWEELALLPGLGPKKARAIVARRESVGAFQSTDDLAAVPGIGRLTAAELARHVYFGKK